METRPFKHWETLSVRWGDMDALGRVNDSRFFSYWETARMSLYRKIELDSFREEDRAPAVVRITCNFRQPLYYPATLDVGLRVARIGERSFTLEYGVYFTGTPDILADGSSVVVWLDKTLRKAQELPEGLKKGLADYTHG